jgi:FixJ family two-component response regulator
MPRDAIDLQLNGNSVTTAASATIAVIDDDCRVRESLDDLLDCAGFRVRLFASPGEFLRSSALYEVDCVISDVAMPAIDGFALQRLIREARPALPVILLTGHHELAAAATEADRGGRVMFEKPFDRDRLLAAINLELQVSADNKSAGSK